MIHLKHSTFLWIYIVLFIYKRDCNVYAIINKISYAGLMLYFLSINRYSLACTNKHQDLYVTISSPQGTSLGCARFCFVVLLHYAC